MKLKDTFYIIFDIDMFYSWGSVKNLRDAFLTPKKTLRFASDRMSILFAMCLFTIHFNTYRPCC